MGVLEAKGTGSAMLSMHEGTVTLAFTGDLWVSEHAGVEVEDTSSGIAARESSGEALFRRWLGGRPLRCNSGRKDGATRKGYLYQVAGGRLRVFGRGFVVSLDGHIDALEAKGAGLAILQGAGTFSVRSDDGVSVTLGSWQPAMS